MILIIKKNNNINFHHNFNSNSNIENKNIFTKEYNYIKYTNNNLEGLKNINNINNNNNKIDNNIKYNGLPNKDYLYGKNL